MTIKKNKKDGPKKSFAETIEPFIYLAPFLAGLIVFTLYPVINVFIISLKEGYNQLTGAYTAIGAANYTSVIDDPYFINSLKNTAIYVAVVVPVSTCLAILIANLLNKKIRGMAIFQTAYFLPMVTSATAVGIAWRLMFNHNFGVINQFLSYFGIDKINWLGNPETNIYALILYGIWNLLPFTIILLLSGLQNIDPQYAIAAKVDGASSRKIFFRITVPLLAPTIGLVMIINTISCSKVYGELFPLFVGRPGTAYNLYTVVYYIYDQFYLKWKLGKACAAAVVLFGMIFIMTKIQLYIQKKWNY